MHPHHNAPRITSKRLAIVARVSTEDQEEYGTSLDDQIAKGRLYAQLHDFSVDDRPYEQGGSIYCGDESGTLPLAHRTIMRRLIADARDRKFDAVCFHKIDRVARRLKYMLEIWDMFDEAGVAVHIIDPGIDTSTAIGRAIRNILGTIAELEADTILERTMGGRRRKLARGELYLPTGKYGYTYTPMDRAKHVPGHVAKHPEQAPVVQRMYERRACGLSPERIAAELTADGIPSPTGDARWHLTTVRRIVADSAYMGTGQWGQRRATRTVRGTRSSKRITDGRGVIEVSYPAIVSKELWQAANRVATCGERHPMRAAPDQYLFAGGMVRCGEHDRAMGGSSTEGRAPRYQCQRPLPTAKRACHFIPARPLEEAVWAKIMAFLLAPEEGMARARALAEEAEQDLERVAARRIAIEQRLRELDEESAYLLRLARKTKVAPAKLEASLAEVSDEEQQLRAERAQLDAQAMLARDEIPRAEELEAICREFRAGAEVAGPAERRELLDALHVKVTLHGVDFTITGLVPELHGHVGVYDDCTSGCRQTPPGQRQRGG
jgi:site-specific DNA recombinase